MWLLNFSPAVGTREGFGGCRVFSGCFFAFSFWVCFCFSLFVLCAVGKVVSCTGKVVSCTLLSHHFGGSFSNIHLFTYKKNRLYIFISLSRRYF